MPPFAGLFSKGIFYYLLPDWRNLCLIKMFCVLFPPAGTREAFLLVASRNQIISDEISSQPNVVRSLVRDGRNIVAVDFDSTTDRIYWSDTTQDRIWSAHKNGSDRTVVSAHLPDRPHTHTHAANTH